MNYLDLIIIYLACGSSFGVYYFFNNRKNQGVLIRSFIVTFVWIPYGIKLLHLKVTNKLTNKSFDRKSSYLVDLQKRFEKLLPTLSVETNLYEFREVFERYKELTLTKQIDKGKPANHEINFFKIIKADNAELSAVCLNRRNQRKLLDHQKYARMDFLSMLKTFRDNTIESNKLGELSLEFVKILNDEQGIASVEKLFNKTKQTTEKKTVNELEQGKWVQTQQKQSNENEVKVPLRAITMTANGLKKD